MKLCNRIIINAVQQYTAKIQVKLLKAKCREILFYYKKKMKLFTGKITKILRIKKVVSK